MLPRLCSSGTVVCLASGPSLVAEDVDYVRGKATVLAINDAIRLAPWAEAICNGHNSGSAALNVAVHLGAKRIVLLGYDMGADDKGRRHFFDTGPTVITSPFDKFRKLTATMVEPLKALGVEVINCSRKTRLECFPCQPLREVL
jgi:hypothetical protein